MRYLSCSLLIYFFLFCSGCVSAPLQKCGNAYFIQDESDSRKSPYDNLQLGIPKTGSDLVVIDREGYAVGFSKKLKVPVWVCWVLTADEVQRKAASRARFEADPCTRYSSIPEDYLRSGFDRGHLAPAADMAYSAETMKESFYMTNMAPQLPQFNRQIWKYLESATRNAALREKRIAVVAGSIFYKDRPIDTIGNGVAVPHAFFRCILDLTPPHKAIGFIMANARHKEHFTVFACSIDEVERITGFQFFNRFGQPDLKKNHSIEAWNWET